MYDTLRLPDGRRLDIYASGPEHGRPLIFHHGTPGSRRPESAIERAAHARGLRYVCASRPGYGDSTRLPRRRVIDVVADTAAVLGAVGASECLVAGHSGGGPHALACAAEMSGVLATLVIAGVVPPDVAGLELTAGMGAENLVEFDNARQGEAVLRPYLEDQRAELLGADVPELIAAMDSLLPDVDREVMSGEIGREFADQFNEGLRNGVDGWVDDDLAFTMPWGFSVGDINTPVTIWQGDQDLMVPFAHGVWLGETIPGVDANLLRGEGHVSIAVGSAERMLDALVALAA